MTKEQVEAKILGFRAEITQSLKELLQRNSNLAEMVSDALREDKARAAPEVQVALNVIRELSLLSLTMVASHSEIIFPEEEAKVAKSPRRKSGVRKGAEAKTVRTSVERKTGAKTFADLLVERITAQLPSRKRTVTKREITSIAKKASAVKKAIAAEKLPPRQGKFTREEAVRIITRVLTTPRKNFKPEKSYNRTQVMNRFGIGPRKLDELSSEIGYDWEKNPMVDALSALQIRGLAQLEKTSGRKKR